jgi:hypothetical protein
MRQLINLIELHGGSCVSVDVLPAQLQRLQVCCFPGDLAFILQLQQLQHLTLHNQSISCEELLTVTQLPALQQLALQYYHNSSSGATTAAHAAVWQQLPKLRELTIQLKPSLQELTAILAGLAACTGLTALKLQAAAWATAGDWPVDGDDDPNAWISVAACRSLAALQNLRDLCITRGSVLEPGDALALTALTGLTRLVLAGGGDGVGDFAATQLPVTGIASSMRGLRHLDLQECALGDIMCLAAIAQLRQLTQLRLEGSKLLTEQQFMMLTGLSKLQELRID